SGDTTAGNDDLQATADGEKNTPSPGFEATPVAQAVIPTDAEIQDRIDEAYARGLSEGDSQARQRLEDGCQRLENLATGLMGQDALDTEELARHIEETVMRLASLRAGYAIKDLPAPCAEIVEQLVRRISKKADGGTLHLNPSDLAVVQPLLENRDSFGQIGFKADDTIMPGDIRLSVGSVEAEDRLNQRAGFGLKDGDEGTEFDEVGRLMRNLLDETSNDTPNNAPKDTPESDGEPL
ncbi:MAG: FliH/SctL family protein, partial [Pseudomonadota bacterium]|nr:FliH/SctL family protein [Pseudomonadota bacterium]